MGKVKHPDGFVAICRCGKITGAMDFKRTDRIDAGKILGKWLFYGCTVQPRFGASWSETIEQCECAGNSHPNPVPTWRKDER